MALQFHHLCKYCETVRSLSSSFHHTASILLFFLHCKLFHLHTNRILLKLLCFERSSRSFTSSLEDQFLFNKLHVYFVWAWHYWNFVRRNRSEIAFIYTHYLQLQHLVYRCKKLYGKWSASVVSESVQRAVFGPRAELAENLYDDYSKNS